MVQQQTHAMAAEPSYAEIQSAMAVILKEGELTQLTSRIVRNQLEDKFGVNFLGRKKEIDRMLMEMIENQEKSSEDEKEEEHGTSEMNGVDKEEGDEEDKESSEESSNAHSDSDNDVEPSPKEVKPESKKESSNAHSDSDNDDEPSPKKLKPESKKESSNSHSDAVDDTHNDNDAELARKLHENEKGLRARRQTARKPVERKKSAKAKKPKEKSGEKTGYGKQMVLSPALAEVVGEEKMARSDVVKKMWQVIRERKLEDPKNKRFMICDEQLQKIFGRKRIQTFGMLKYLKKHIWDPAYID